MYTKKLIPSKITKNWRIVAVCDNRKNCQVDEFLATLPANLKKDGKRIQALFVYVTEHGPQQLDIEVSHNIAPEIFQFIRGDLRVVWFYDGGKLVVCCHGFTKKGRKTPPNIIAAAQQAKSDYFAAKAQQKIIELPEKEET